MRDEIEYSKHIPGQVGSDTRRGGTQVSDQGMIAELP